MILQKKYIVMILLPECIRNYFIRRMRFFLYENALKNEYVVEFKQKSGNEFLFRVFFIRLQTEKYQYCLRKKL